jgi:hypothetical protein
MNSCRKGAKNAKKRGFLLYQKSVITDGLVLILFDALPAPRGRVAPK